MASRSLTVHRVPKYERLKQMARRYLSLDPTALEPILALLVVTGEISTVIGANLARYGLSEGRILVLAMLLEHQPDPLSPSELAELAGVTKASITALLDGLESEGYVKREESGHDGRMTPVSLTPAGRKHIEKIMPEHCARLAGLVSRLSVAERKTLVVLLQKVLVSVPALKRF